MNLPLAIVIVYIVVLFAVSWYSSKKAKEGGTLGYFLAGRGFPFYVVAAMIAGLAIGGASTVGVAENAYGAGLSAGMYTAAWAVGALMVGLMVSVKFREMNITTIPEMLENYYDLSGRIIGVVGQLIIQIVITSLQYVAGGAILAALLPDVFTVASGTLFSAVVFIAITLIGGYWGAGLTNIVNVIVIYIGVVVGSIMSLNQAGGFSGLSQSLPEGGHWFDPISGIGFAVVLAWFVVLITQTYSTQAIVQISFAAKDGKNARLGFIVGAIIILPIGFLSAIFGIVAAAQHPGIEATMALPTVVMQLTPLVAGLTLAGLWAADVSTASALLLGSSNLVVQDIWKRFINPNMTQKQEALVSRMTVLVISIFTYILAANVIGIIQTLLIGLTLTTAYTIVILFSIFAPKICKRGCAFWTILVGIIFLAVWVLVPAVQIVPHPVFLAWPICLITFLIVAAVDKRPATI
ncbi:SSS family solute:Na+ symporter [Desulfitispora alkaliphila]|uniref:sodium:solute symporter family protein n=1 Tax=Desulfitispora alkaliphila TaxID=622674 RepID=UPI003D21EBB3